MTQDLALQQKALEAYTRDVGYGAARIDYATMDKIGVVTGACVELIVPTTERSIVAFVLPLYPADEGKDIVRLDSTQRSNLHIQVGDSCVVKARKDVVDAQYIVFSPLEEIPPIDERYLIDALEPQIVKVGMIVSVPYFGARFTFEVTQTSAPVVKIQKMTQVAIQEDEILPNPLPKNTLKPFKVTQRKLDEQCKARNHTYCAHKGECECECHK